MSQMIFVNLPVADLERSKDFYEAIGFTNNPEFSNDKASAMIVNAKSEAQVLLCISRDSREAVDAITEKAGTAGGTVEPCPKQEMDFMYSRSFEDPDGHIWEPMWMQQDG